MPNIKRNLSFAEFKFELTCFVTVVNSRRNISKQYHPTRQSCFTSLPTAYSHLYRLRMASSAAMMADREGLLAETEMDGREKYQWIRPERRTCMTTLQSFSWLVNLILLMINTIGLLYLVHSMSGAQSPDSACPIQVGGDYTHEGPICKLSPGLSRRAETGPSAHVSERLANPGGYIVVLTNVQKWKADPDFTPLSATEFLKPKTQAKWGSLIPGETATSSSPIIDY